MSYTRQRLQKVAGVGQAVGKGLRALPDGVLFPGVALGGAVAYHQAGKAAKDYKRGRNERKAREAQEEMARYSKYASAPTLFSRESHQIFPLASESGAISWRQSFLDGLLANKEKMGKMAHEQLKDLFPASAKHGGHKHGYRQRSMTTGKDAGSALIKAFKSTGK